MRWAWAWSAGCLLACAGPPAQYGSVCRGRPDCPGITMPGGGIGGGGGGGGSDGGADAFGDGFTGSAVTVVASVLVPTQIPVVATSTGIVATPTGGWTVESVADPSIGGISSANGVVTLTGVPVRAGSYQLRAVPPVGVNAGLSSLATLTATGSTSQVGVVTIPLTLLESTVGGVPVDTSSAHLVLQLRGNVAGVSANVAGPTGTGTPTQILYDDDATSGFLEADSMTGNRGTILLLNIPVLATPYTVTITLTRAGRTTTLSWPVERGAVEWLTPTAP